MGYLKRVETPGWSRRLGSLPDHKASQGVSQPQGQGTACRPSLLGSEVLVGDASRAEVAVGAVVPQQVPRAGTWMWVTVGRIPGLQQLEGSLKLLPRGGVAHPCLVLGGSYTAAEESVHLGGGGQERPAGGEEMGYEPVSACRASPTADHAPPPVPSDSAHRAARVSCSSTSGLRPELLPLPKILPLPDILKEHPFTSNQTLPPHKYPTPGAAPGLGQQ